MNQSSNAILPAIGLATGVVGAIAAASMLTKARSPDSAHATARPRSPSIRIAARRGKQRSGIASHIAAARSFNRGSALLAWSALTDSAIEHYRGSFENPGMYVPLATGALSLAAGMHGSADRIPSTHSVRQAIYLAAAGAGIAGTGFHIYNVTKRPGQWSWHNLFYGAPLGAPMALFLSGALGVVGERLRDQPAEAPRAFGMPAGKALALLTAAGLIGTLGEVALLHFRGAFQHRAMYAPIAVTPVAAALLTQAALTKPRHAWWTRLWLRVTAALGIVGVGFHTRGIARQQGGWRNWSQNVLNGPPLPAPPSFTALALAGLAALRLREAEK